MKSYPLHPSPIAVMRAKYRLDQLEAARRLGLSLGQLKVLEMRTGEVPPDILEVIDLLLGPPTCYRQISIWEALEELGRLDAQKDGGEGGARA
jgi:hypothetical protein